MQPPRMLLCTIAIGAMMAATPVAADTLKSGVAFNNGIGEKGGDIDGCTVDIVEALYGRLVDTLAIRSPDGRIHARNVLL